MQKILHKIQSSISEIIYSIWYNKDVIAIYVDKIDKVKIAQYKISNPNLSYRMLRKIKIIKLENVKCNIKNI